ncbi:hypothetical protein IAR50_001656 [Cryptococcus sp. DSM 104548]
MVNVFFTGASGFIGSHLVPLLQAAGHKVSAIARSDSAAKALEAKGITVIRGSLEDTDVLFKAASEADAVVHLGFIHDFANFDKAVEIDLAAIEAFGKALKGTNKPLLTASGFLLATSPTPTELTPSHNVSRGQAEHLFATLAASGVRAITVRLPFTVHGDGDQAFVPAYIQQSKKAGFAGYVGEGENHWPAVHVDDAAQVFKLALESTSLKGGEILHATHEAGVPFKSIAETVAARLGIPTKSITEEEGGEKYTWLVMFLKGDVQASSELTREWLGWVPKGKGTVEDLNGTGWYFTEEAVPKF